MASSVHPHACGEHYHKFFYLHFRAGSSPRMWGTHDSPTEQAERARFIPTHVGNTIVSSFSASSNAVHPHACGEHHCPSYNYRRHPGSSPRMWGTQHVLALAPSAERFIPTHVGNTPLNAAGATSNPVHPHACGEHQLIVLRPAEYRGSSPRMWGTPTKQRNNHDYKRFIPTHVGNTVVGSRWRYSQTVHPHACGEHLVIR